MIRGLLKKARILDKPFKAALIFMVLVELASFYASFFAKFNAAVFGIIILAVFVASLCDFRYGLYALLAELFVGSKGHLFFFNAGPVTASLRMGLFSAVFLSWTIWLLKDKNKRRALAEIFKKNRIVFPLGLVIISVLWSAVRGVLAGNPISDVFADANAWIFFCLGFVFLATVRTRQQVRHMLQILAAALVVMGAKALILLELFSHNVNMATPFLYRWSSAHGLVEITRMADNFYRIFSQAQIFSLAGFFVFAAIAASYFGTRRRTSGLFKRQKARILPYACVALSGLSVLVSFSRSFWLGAMAGLVFFFRGLKFVFKKSWKTVARFVGILALVVVLEVGLVYVMVRYPEPSREAVSFTSLLEDRVAKSGSEDASMSRFNLLPPLMEKIMESPVLGSGFGTSVSYRSLDPRNRGDSPDDLYTTYAFEWGYLDMWLKMGLFGLLAYGWLLFEIWKKGWGIIKLEAGGWRLEAGVPGRQWRSAIAFGLLAGLVAVCTTHIASPYLNHPLGIGYLLLCAAIFGALERKRLFRTRESGKVTQ